MVMREVVTACFLILFCACNNTKKKPAYSVIPGYDMVNPVVIQLKSDLDELSGIYYYAKDTSVFAINDELGVLYKIYLRKQIKVKTWKFSGDGDYEDISFRDGTFYVLASNGSIKSFQFVEGDSVHVNHHGKAVGGTNDFETLYYDSYYGKFVVVCKDCESDDKKTVSAYSFNPDDETFSEEPFYQIDTDEIARLLGSDKIKFKPSAAAINPVTKDLYIVSSVNKAIAVTDRKGKIKEVYKVDPLMFKQPEGITFTPNGDMLISNESAEIGSATILIFKYKPLLHEKG
ncbi:MAG TPA: hypothetical protein VF623_15810 [Segetibacter sp.]|jgi:DNA-binding beta-propeller fold protein YncE